VFAKKGGGKKDRGPKTAAPNNTRPQGGPPGVTKSNQRILGGKKVRLKKPMLTVSIAQEQPRLV